MHSRLLSHFLAFHASALRIRTKTSNCLFFILLRRNLSQLAGFSGSCIMVLDIGETAYTRAVL